MGTTADFDFRGHDRRRHRRTTRVPHGSELHEAATSRATRFGGAPSANYSSMSLDITNLVARIDALLEVVCLG
jgi:hypothetical protein